MIPYNEQNWTDVLDSLGFTEQKNPNGGMIVYNNEEVPMWRYEENETKEKLYYFFSGMVCQRMKNRFN
jgi:hypothetical protein